jgi:tetrahydromethanopterin S-methyltransferase subunit E
MKWQIHKRISPIAVAIMALLAVVVHLLLHVPLWLALVFTILGIVINAIVASAGGDAP